MKTRDKITLLNPLSKDAYKYLKEARNKRIRVRLNCSGDLGFRQNNIIIKKHGNIKEKYGYPSTAKCFVCDQVVSMCICKIEIAEINKSTNNDI